MNPENLVIFKGTRDGINIIVDKSADFDEIKSQLEKKVLEATKFFSGAKANIFFSGRDLSTDEEMDLLEIISEKTQINITYVDTKETNENEEAKPVEITNDKALDLGSLVEEQLKQHNLTKFYKGNIRSGQEISFVGSIVIIGDVNPGAFVKAGGNIIILGSLKGIAHAGCNGMRDAFIAAISMRPVQLRIADIITRFPVVDDKNAPIRPEYAYIEDGQVYVLQLA